MRTLLFSVACSLAVGVSIGGCSTPITGGTSPGGFRAEGSCMCATCFTAAFCQDVATGAVSLVPPGGCPTGWLESERATRITATGTEEFFCIPPGDGAVLGTGGACVSGPAGLLARNVDECIDVARCARSPLDDCLEPPLPGVSCADPDDFKYRSDQFLVCTPGGDLSAAAEAVCGNMEHNDVAPPSTAPERYCFVSCLDIFSDAPTCDPALFDPPYIDDVGDILLEIGTDPVTGVEAFMEVTVTVEGATSNAVVHGITGIVHLNARDCGPGVFCQAEVSSIELHSPNFSVAGQVVSEILLLNPRPLADDVVPVSPDRSHITIDAGGVLYASGVISGLGRTGTAFELDEDITGVLDWSEHTFGLDAFLGNAATGTSIRLGLRGRIPSVPPRADAGPDQTVECSGPDSTEVTLTASGSIDPDGDLLHWVWSDDALGLELGDAENLTIPMSLGSHSIHLSVEDGLGQADRDRVDVAVLDSTGPVFDDVAVATDCLWPPDHSLHLFRLGTEIVAHASDACEGLPSTVRIVEVRSDQPADGLGDGSTLPDVVFGESAVCLRGERSGTSRRPRGYTVVLEATDSSGNVTRSEVNIRVPHDQRPSDRCLLGDLAAAVADGDARCTAPLPSAAPAGVPSPDAGALTPPAGACSASRGRGSASVSLGLFCLALLVAGRRR